MNGYVCRNCGLHGNRLMMRIHLSLWQCTNRDTPWTWRVLDGGKRPKSPRGRLWSAMP